jgi:large subunit ribosomal protein L2
MEQIVIQKPKLEQISKISNDKTYPKIQKAGKNNRGVITVKHRGGGHKKLYRKIDFKRDIYNIPGIVKEIRYDPNRTSNIACINYYNLFYRYILSPNNLKIDNKVKYTKESSEKIGDVVLLKNVPQNALIHNIQINKNKGGQMIRSAGTFARVVKNYNENSLILQLGSKSKYIVNKEYKATIGQVSNIDLKHRKLKKAGNSRWLGIRPTTRGVAMNPVDHPHGGGEGKSSGGRPSVSPKGRITKGKKTVITKRKKLLMSL